MITGNNKKNGMFLGIDLGTGSLKAVLVDLEGNQIARTKAAYPTQSPNPGWAQQNPGDWLKALEIAIPALLDESGATTKQIRSIGLCGAAHIPVLLDRNDRPTHPSILWSDCRSTREVEYLAAEFGEIITRRTGNRIGCAWTLPQLCWLRNHVPEAIDRTETFLTSKDYLVYTLTGEKISDTGSATATMLYDPGVGEWASELVDQTGLPERVFPEVFEPAHLVGETTSSASRFGLSRGIPVISGCLDSVAEMIAAGGWNENDCVLRLGTAGAILMLGRNTGYTPGLYNYPFPGETPSDEALSIFQAGTSSCGRSMDWIRELLTSSREETESVAGVSPGSDGLFFHPFLHGERAPYFNPELRGGFIGLTSNHNRAHFLRAVMEGVAFSLLDCMNSTNLFDSLPDSIRVVGGGTRLPSWMTILSNVLNMELLSLNYADSAFGAAMLASQCFFAPDEIRRIAFRHGNACRIYSPEFELSQSYAGYFQTYHRIANFLNSLYRSEESVVPHI